ncbi:MAG: DNA damage-inducible protein D [Candidatus Hydrogenedentes bacterium]|nr:DNA damage-inducible protein D [Candidatus Hydrogenedentota bacterium]
MKRELIVQLHGDFEQLVKHEEESGVEFWLARDLQSLLGYAKWENFFKVIEKARSACQNAGYVASDHFLDIRKMVGIGSGAQRPVDDIALTRYACYLIAQNGDPAKPVIAFAQTYFAVQTRKQEIIEQRLAEVERLTARRKLTASEKELSGIIYERVGDEQSFGRIRSKGDMALFGGLSTQDMKDRLSVAKGRPLADFLPTITIKAKDFANEITNFNIKRDDLKTEPEITSEHVRNNADVRDLLGKRGIIPEKLPRSEDTKKIERRLQSEGKKLPKEVERLEHRENDVETDE